MLRAVYLTFIVCLGNGKWATVIRSRKRFMPKKITPIVDDLNFWALEFLCSEIRNTVVDSFVRRVAVEIGAFFLKILCKNRVIKGTQRQLCAEAVQLYHFCCNSLGTIARRPLLKMRTGL
jgi:hypothetical protein